MDAFITAVTGLVIALTVLVWSVIQQRKLNHIERKVDENGKNKETPKG